MVTVHHRLRDFRAPLTYLLRHRGEAGAERVAWTAARNLPTDDPDLVVGLMRATAARSLRVEKPAYHIALSFAPDDPVDRARMERVASRILTHLGLAEHEALLVAHRDTPQPHVHILVNLVHPDTGRRRSTWKAWVRVREVLRDEERALGLRQVAGPKERVPALAHELRTYERQTELGRELYRAQTATNNARERGMRLDQAAQHTRNALVNADRALARVYREPALAYQAYVAAADRQGLAETTERMRHHPERFGALATVERWRAFDLHLKSDDRDAHAAAPAAATAAQEALAATRGFQQAAEAEVQRVEQDFEHALAAIYQQPAAVRGAFQWLAHDHGVEHAGTGLREQPLTFGVLLASVSQDPRRLEEEVNQAAARGLEALQVRATATALVTNPREATPEAVQAVTCAGTDRAAARVAALQAELQKLPTLVELERRIRYGLDRLPSFELRHLEATVTAPQFAIAMRVGRIARDIALGREEERELAK